MNPNEEQKNNDGWIEYALRQLQEQYKFNPEQAELQIETCTRFFRSQVASREAQAAENAARVVLEAVEQVDVQALFTPEGAQQKCEEAIRSAASQFINRKGE